MRIILPSLIGVALVAVAAAAPPRESPVARAERETTAQLAALTPGAPVPCLDTRTLRPALSAIGSRLIYKVNPRLIYVSETAGGCEQVARGDILVTRQYGNVRVCRGDIAQTLDRVTRFPTGSCAIGEFVPYRPAAAQSNGAMR